jgi:hypothetical protein
LQKRQTSEAASVRSFCLSGQKFEPDRIQDRRLQWVDTGGKGHSRQVKVPRVKLAFSFPLDPFDFALSGLSNFRFMCTGLHPVLGYFAPLGLLTLGVTIMPLAPPLENGGSVEL